MPSPSVLRRRAIVAFDRTCAYCSRQGDDLTGPDGKPWELDRIKPGAAGGEYVPENVALACGPCNRRKTDAVGGWPTPSLADLEVVW